MGTENSESNALLTPYQMGPFKLSHRIVYAPLTRDRATGTISQPAAVTYYSQRATEGGLMVSEATCVSVSGHGYPDTPGIYTPDQVAAWKPVTAAVKAKGAVFFCQLWHAGRASHESYQTDGALPLAPSAVALPKECGPCYSPQWEAVEYPEPKAMTEEDIAVTIRQYAVAATNALEAGFEGVEIHGGNGYLPDQFLKENTNQRTDIYGGSIPNRARFMLAVVDAVIAAVGAQKVGIRLSPFAGFLDVHDSDPNATNLYLVAELNQRNVLYAHFVEPRVTGNDDREAPKGTTLEPFRRAFKNTFIAAGGYKRESGIEAIKNQNADLICYGRLYLANPDFVERIEKDAPLNAYDRSSFYSPDQVKGYTDYPFLSDGVNPKAA